MGESSEKSALASRMQMRRASQGISRAQGASDKQKKNYGEIIVEHLRDNGSIVCFTDDLTFSALLRELVTGTLKMPAATLQISSRPDRAALVCRKAVDAKKAPLIIIERELNGRDMVFTARLLKNAFPELKLLMLTAETDRNRFVLMHESGVDACLVKPLDGPGLLEKLALAIRPNEQLERNLDWARSLLNQGEAERALQICTQTLEKQANPTATLLLMGEIFQAMKEYDKAVEAFTKASSGSAIFLEPLKKLADLYGEKGDLKKQIEYLEKMDELSPLNLERKIQIGEIMLKLGQQDKARKIFDQAMKLTNRQAKEHISSVAFRVANIYTDKDPDMAASFLQKGLDARKEFWGHEDLATFNRLGLLLRRAGKWREAANEYLKALTVAPNDESLHFNLAMAYLEGKDLEAARASALKAMALNPDLPRKSSRIASNLAAVFMSTNDKMHALPLLRVALEQDPDNAEARELVAQAEKE